MVELLVSHQPVVCSAVGANPNSIVPLLNASRANSLRVSLCLVCDDLLDDPLSLVWNYDKHIHLLK
jgi:hypothetical protein